MSGPPIGRITTEPPLAEFRRQLRAQGPKWRRELQRANKEIAEMLTKQVRASYQRSHASSRRYRQIRPRASQTWSGIVLGEMKAGGMVGQNFGANPGSRDSLGRRMGWLPPRTSPDYHLYAQLGENSAEIAKKHRELVDRVMEEAFPGATGALLRRVT